RRRALVSEDGSLADVRVVRRDALQPGDNLIGPAIVEDFGATIRVLDGQSLEVRSSGMLVLSDKGAAQ
ncbi:MAG: hypothetical protein VW835_03785, partial [Rickettsiales bacterium]